MNMKYSMVESKDASKRVLGKKEGKIEKDWREIEFSTNLFILTRYWIESRFLFNLSWAMVQPLLKLPTTMSVLYLIMLHNDGNGKVSVFYLEYLKIMTDEHTDRHSKYTVATKNKIRNYELYNK